MRIVVLTVALAATTAASASAGDIFTPNVQVVGANARVFCQANNVGTKTGPITVTIFNSDASKVEMTNTCDSVAPIHACLAATSGALSAGFDAYCGVKTKLKVRAVIKVQDTTDNSIIQALPATR